MRIHSHALWALTVCLAASVALAQGQKKPAGKAASGKTKITWYGHAAFLVETPGGAKIAIDPWMKNPKAPTDLKAPTALDAILVTHGHFDHVGEAQ